MAVPSNLSTSPPSSPVQSDNEQPGPSTVPVTSVANPSGAEGPETQDSAGINQPSSSRTSEEQIVQALKNLALTDQRKEFTDWLRLAQAESQQQTTILYYYKLYTLVKEGLLESQVKEANRLFSEFNKNFHCISNFDCYKKHTQYWYPINESRPYEIIKHFLSEIEVPLSDTNAHHAMQMIFCFSFSFSYGGKEYFSSEIYQKILDRCKALENTHKVCGRLAYQYGLSNNLAYANGGLEKCEKYTLEDYMAFVDGTHRDYKYEPSGPSTVPVASVANSSGAEGPETKDTAGINPPPPPQKTPEQKILHRRMHSLRKDL